MSSTLARVHRFALLVLFGAIVAARIRERRRVVWKASLAQSSQGTGISEGRVASMSDGHMRDLPMKQLALQLLRMNNLAMGFQVPHAMELRGRGARGTMGKPAVKMDALPSAISALSDLGDGVTKIMSALTDLGDGVQVQEISHGRVFMPRAPRLGLVYVPGALIDSRAYAPLCRDIAKRSGCAVALIDFPLGIARFEPSRISGAMFDVGNMGASAISRWVVGGHSLGGTVAIKFLLDQRSKNAALQTLQSGLFQPELVGVLLHGSFNNEQQSVPDDIPVLQVLAENDGLVSDMKILKQGLPPSNTVTVNIAGANHAGFAYYGPHPLDGERTIGLENQQNQAADATVKWLRDIDQV